jgi:putative SOS response-associated peptidase YedK
MCNLYSITKGQAAIIELARALRDITGNLPPMPGVFPDYLTPVVRNAPDGVRELAKLRWGMPSSQSALMEATKRRAAKLEAKGQAVDFKQLLRVEPDSGTTNIRNVQSKHWTRWLGIESRCVVPFTRSASSIRPKEAISGSRSMKRDPWPSSPASGRRGRPCEK